MTICILNQKGGVGKTTTAINLMAAALEADETRRGVLIDLDTKTASASRYDGSIARCQWRDAMPATTPENAVTVIDTPGDLSPALVPILRRCDLIIVPCVPDAESAHGTRITLEALPDVLVEGDARLLFTRCRFNRAFENFQTGFSLSARESLATAIPSRESEASRAASRCVPVVASTRTSPLADAYRALWREIEAIKENSC